MPCFLLCYSMQSNTISLHSENARKVNRQNKVSEIIVAMIAKYNKIILDLILHLSNKKCQALTML